MGSASSLRRGDDDDDDSGQGVRSIPIEYKPRGKLGLRSAVTSFGKKTQKGGSLKSIPPEDLTDPVEVERLKNVLEMEKKNKDYEIGNMKKKLTKMEQEYSRLRCELNALQQMCNKLREEKERAITAEKDATNRAAHLESDRDRIQRRFKIYRENKENEFQSLLNEKRNLERHHYKSLPVGLDHERDGSQKSGDNMLGNPGDWWTALESEPSLGSTSQLHTTTMRGPELAHSMELDGPFTNINKDDWSMAAASLAQILPTAPDTPQSNTVRIYICATDDRFNEVNNFIKDYHQTLDQLCHSEGRFCLLIYMPLHTYTNKQLTKFQTENLKISSCTKRIQQSTIFLAFIGSKFSKYTELECQHGHLDNPGGRAAVFCFPSPSILHENRTSGEYDRMFHAVQQSGSAKLVEGYTSIKTGTREAYEQVAEIIKQELGICDQKDNEVCERELEQEGTEMLCGGCLWDPKHDYEQIESLNTAAMSSCQLGFEKYYDQLHSHVSNEGPVPPLLVIGEPGSGKSLLLAKWMELLHQKSSSSLVLYHLADPSQSCSTDPILMIRRLTSQLMQHVTAPPALTSDPQRLQDEFPKWLEKVSSKIGGGIILILDSGDRFHKCEQRLKWLLDPLPVDTKVVISVQENTCPQTWKSWPNIKIEELSNRCVKDLLQMELASQGQGKDHTVTLTPSQLDRIQRHCTTSQTSNPLYVVLLAKELARTSLDSLEKRLDALLATRDTIQMYKAILDSIRHDHETGSNKGLMKQILCLIYASRNGLNESELFSLVSGLTWIYWSMLLDALIDRNILVWRSGLLIFTHQQTRQAVFEKYMGEINPRMLQKSRDMIMKYFVQFESKLMSIFRFSDCPADVTYRVADELPWICKKLGEKETLRRAITNLCIFVKLYGRGRSGELIGYWQLTGADKNTMASNYVMALKVMEKMVGEHEGIITMIRIADVYEALGRFLRDLGLLTEASAPLQRALEIRETELDPDHPKVAQTLHQVASLHAQWNKFSVAEALYKQAMTMYEEKYGKEHYLVAKELDALAVLYQKQGKGDLAENIHRKALTIRRKCMMPRTTTAGHIRSIDPLRRRVVQLEELAIGPDSADLAKTLNELGVLSYIQNNIESAESFIRRSLEMRQAVLPEDHIDISQSLNNLAALYNDRKQYDEAAPLYEKALSIREKHFDKSDHASVTTIVRHLAVLYRKMEYNDKAINMYDKMLHICERTFNENHPSVATVLVNIAVIHSQMKDYSAALPLYERALKIYEESFSPRHPLVAETLRNLAKLKYDKKEFQEAAKLYKRATEIKETEASMAGRGGMRLRRNSQTTDTSSTVKSRGPSPAR